MAISPKCDVRACQKGLDQPGALLFSPGDETGRVVKLHVCQEDYGRILAAFFDGRAPGRYQCEWAGPQGRHAQPQVAAGYIEEPRLRTASALRAPFR